MIDTPNLDGLARVLGEPTRLRMLAQLMSGRALTAKELAYGSGVEPASATPHLQRLLHDGLVACRAQGRHKYFRLASPEVAHLIESMMVVAPASPVTRPVPDPLRRARYCYDHLAGELGVRLTDAMQERGWLARGSAGFTLCAAGETALCDFGLDLPTLRRRRRQFAPPCLDWSERRDHLGGALGAALATRFVELGWICPIRQSRAVSVTESGLQGLYRQFGVAADTPSP